ncbi:hypothetical protein [Vannielia litorea]|nr:hypothetical protein [Vannielia litorea]
MKAAAVVGASFALVVPAQAGGLGVGVSVGGISAGVSVGGGSVASADVSVGGSGGVNADATVGGGGGSVADVNVGVGGGGSNLADVDVSVGGGGSGGGSGGGAGTPTTPGTPGVTTTRAEPFGSAIPAKRFMAGDLVGTVVLSSDGQLVGEVVHATMSNGKIRARVALADSLKVRADYVVLSLGKSSVKDRVVWLSMSRNRFVSSVKNS